MAVQPMAAGREWATAPARTCSASALRRSNSSARCNSGWGCVHLVLLLPRVIAEHVGEEAAKRPELGRVVLGGRASGKSQQTDCNGSRSVYSLAHVVPHPSNCMMAGCAAGGRTYPNRLGRRGCAGRPREVQVSLVLPIGINEFRGLVNFAELRIYWAFNGFSGNWTGAIRQFGSDRETTWNRETHE